VRRAFKRKAKSSGQHLTGILAPAMATVGAPVAGRWRRGAVGRRPQRRLSLPAASATYVGRSTGDVPACFGAPSVHASCRSVSRAAGKRRCPQDSHADALSSVDRSGRPCGPMPAPSLEPALGTVYATVLNPTG
jgi:hypothetical protein